MNSKEIPVVENDDDFVDAVVSLGEMLQQGQLGHASYSAVHYLRQVPGGDSLYMGSSFIIHSGAEEGTSFPNNMALMIKLQEQLKPQIDAQNDQAARTKSGAAPDQPPNIIRGKGSG